MSTSIQRPVVQLCLLIVCVLVINDSLQAQSLDARSPTPVRSNEIVGSIAARDIGDPRLTDHFYTFTGTPGDLLITVQTRNLNGDIDVFTAGSLRPVLKLSVYAEVASPVTKSIYLRQREELIIRIEARSPNDEEGVYNLKFGGSFEPIIRLSENEEAPSTTEAATNQPVRRGKRVSSVGARIEEPAPPPDVAAAATPEPTPSAPTETVTPESKPEAPKETSATPKARNARSRPPLRTRTKPAPTEEAESKPITETAAPKSGEETSKVQPTETLEPKPLPVKKSSRKARNATETAESARTETPAPADSSRTEAAVPSDSTRTEAAAAKSRKSKRSTAAAAEAPADTPEEESPAKLVIEMMDGSRFERFMSAVRRVTVESGQIVVTCTDGKVERIRLATVLRMSIGP